MSHFCINGTLEIAHLAVFSSMRLHGTLLYKWHSKIAHLAVFSTIRLPGTLLYEWHARNSTFGCFLKYETTCHTYV